jgi:hypothetical protein
VRNMFRGGPVAVLNCDVFTEWNRMGLRGPDVCGCVDLYDPDMICFD